MYNSQGIEPSPAELIQVKDKTLCHLVNMRVQYNQEGQKLNGKYHFWSMLMVLIEWQQI